MIATLVIYGLVLVGVGLVVGIVAAVREEIRENRAHPRPSEPVNWMELLGWLSLLAVGVLPFAGALIAIGNGAERLVTGGIVGLFVLGYGYVWKQARRAGRDAA